MEGNDGPKEEKGVDVPSTASMTRQKRKIIKRELEYNPDKGQWSTDEKRCFLNALKKHGCTNISALQKEVQTKSEESIKLFITHCGKHARYLMETRSEKNAKKYKSNGECCKHKKFKSGITDEAVDQWLQRLHAAEPPAYNEIKSLPIARAFLYISKFEEHPDPKDCQGVDFKSLYETLYYMLCGLPGKQLNKQTVDFFENTIDELTQLVLTAPMANKSDVLRDVPRIRYTPSGSVRKYPGKKQTAASENNNVLELQGYNPLGLPRDYLSFSDLRAEVAPKEEAS